MARINLYPPYGTISEASSVKFEITDIGVNEFHFNMENATNGVKIDVKSLEKKDDGSYAGIMNLNIPEHSSQSAISIFAYIDEPQKDGTYKTIQICPAIFDIKEEHEIDGGKLIVTPSFVGQKDLCSIRVMGENGSTVIFSINDKIFKVIINEGGFGTIHFKGKDIVGDKDLESINKIPIYLYDNKDNTIKFFSGSYLNILPSTIVMHIEDDIDLRCDASNPAYIDPPGSWVRPAECDAEPCDPTIEICDCDPVVEDCECNPDLESCGECNPDLENCDSPGVCIRAIDIPTSCNSGDVTINTSDICRIHNNSVVLLNNGMALHAYTSPDKTYENSNEDERYNINRIFIAAQKTAIDVQIIFNRDVVIEPKEPLDDFRIHVDSDVGDVMLSFGDLLNHSFYIIFYDNFIGFQKVRITEAEVNEYTGEVVLIGAPGNTNVKLNGWMFCVNSVLQESTEDPNLYINSSDGSDFMALPFVRNSFESGDYVQPVNVSIASNKEYIGEDGEVYVYFIVEAITENNLSQLYFNSMSIGQEASFNQKTYGWVRLTDETQGNNRNPRAIMDSANNLHVVFESDRGGISQLYYGDLGINYKSPTATSFSSAIDKYSEFLSQGDFPFDYLKPLLLKAADSQEYSPIPEYDTESIISNGWSVIEGNGGSVIQTSSLQFLNDITITSNSLSQEAMAVASLQIVSDLDANDPSIGFPYSQFNYQISFDLKSKVEQTSSLVDGADISESVIDSLFKEWKDSFTIETDAQVKNQPVYIDVNNNKFTIGRSDNVFDRIVPLVGAYRHEDINPSDAGFQIKILKNDSNLKDFTFGLMFEKTYFKASNVQKESEYISDGNSPSGYTIEDIEIIYTGRAKLVVFIKTEEKSETRADYIIVREFPEVIDMRENSSYDIILNYVKIESSEVSNILNTYKNTYSDKFLGTITLLINNVPKFSQSFISTLPNDYNYFDIGLGIPDGGYYIADKMAPSKLGVFDDIETILYFSNITITSPTYTYNDEVVSLPPTVRDMTKLRVKESIIEAPSGTSIYEVSDRNNDLISLNFVEKEDIKYFAQESVTTSSDFNQLYNVENVEKVSIEFITFTESDRMTVSTEGGIELYDTGFVVSSSDAPLKFDVDVDMINNIYISVDSGSSLDSISYSFTAYFKKVYNDNTFLQVPITFGGVNQSASLDVGICNDVHIAWQSNKDKYWDIYYTNSEDELSPFRHDTQITNTKSNSIKPSISVNRNGKRMIAWNDNRNGNYTIYVARSLSGYGCNQKSCEIEMVESFKDEIEECNLVIDFTPAIFGIYNFILYFYSDSSANNLFKSIPLEGNEERWFIDGVSIIDSLIYDDEDVLLGVELEANVLRVISYLPDKDDKIFDTILYVKLNSVLREDE